MINNDFIKILAYIIAFGLIAVASGHVSVFFKKIRLPLITGLLIIGIIAGPEVLGMIDREAVSGLRFINHISLAFIALAVGSELYIKEVRSRMKSISWMTAAQLLITFVFGFLVVWFLAGKIPFLQGKPVLTVVSAGLLTGTIFVARSPASAIAIIDEMRAYGPFTQTALGVTVVKDFLVIIVFSVIFTLSGTLIKGEAMGAGFILQLVVELGGSLLLGLLLWKFLAFILSTSLKTSWKVFFVIFSGYSIFLFSALIRQQSLALIEHEIYVEPLLSCIIGSFAVTNYSRYRPEFSSIIERSGPYVYVVFFTLTGASLNIHILEKVWVIAIIFFAVRLFSLVVAGITGGRLAGESWKFSFLAWMPYMTQAGVGLGLATIIAAEYPGWGSEFATLMIAVIVMNQIIGPPFFKWAIQLSGEAHKKHKPTAQSGRKALIFGFENQSVALAKQLKFHGWKVSIATRKKRITKKIEKGIKIERCRDITRDQLRDLGAWNSEAIICLLSDEENYRICEIVYENFGTKTLIVRMQDRKYYPLYKKLGVVVMEPATAMVALLEHYVRSPITTSILLGEEEEKDTIDIEVVNHDIHGLALRDLRLPNDVIILSVSRGGQMIISHGYTRLRMGDIVTLVGSPKSLENVRLRIQGY